jgi:hypothetical protein
MNTPFPYPLSAGLIVDIATPADLAPLAGEVRAHGRRNAPGTLRAWHLIALKSPTRTEVIGLGWLPDGEIITTSPIKTVDGGTILTATGETYVLGLPCSKLYGTIPSDQLEHFWMTLRARGLIEPAGGGNA